MIANPADALLDLLDPQFPVLVKAVRDQLAALTARVAEQADEIVRLEQMAESRLRAIEALKPAALAGAGPDVVAVPREPTPEWFTSVVREVQPKLFEGCRAWTQLIGELLYWHAAIIAATPHAPAKAREDEAAKLLARVVACHYDVENGSLLDEEVRTALATFAEGRNEQA